MRYVIGVMAAVLLIFDAAAAQQTAVEEISAGRYANLQAAVTDMGAAPRSLIISNAQTISSPLTVPANVALRVTGGGQIAIPPGMSLTINGAFEAPLRQVFTGGGAVRWGSHVATVYPQWWGAKMDGVADDTAAIQRAIDSFAGSGAGVFRAGVVELVGGAVITSSLKITLSAVILRGTGWGIQADALKRGFIKWEGAAGTPMILIQDALQSGVEKIRLVGNSKSKPSAAIEIKQSASGPTQDQAILRDLYIGAYFSTDTDKGVQFSNGILLTGAVNSDFNVCENITIQKCDVGVFNNNPNASITNWRNLAVGECGSGFKTVTQNSGSNWLFALNKVDLDFAGPSAELYITHFVSEGSGRLAVMPYSFNELVIKDGSFQLYRLHFTPADSDNNRYLIDGQNQFGGNLIHLESFDVTAEVGVTVNHVIRQKTSSPGAGYVSTLRLIDVGGLTANNIDVGGAAGIQDNTRVIEFRRKPRNGTLAPASALVHLNGAVSEDNAFNDTRTDIIGKLNLYGGPLKVRRIPAPAFPNVTPTGSGTTPYSYRVTALTLDGETAPGPAVTCLNASRLTSRVYNTITWASVLGAYAYRIYGRTTGSERLLKTVTIADLGDTAPSQWVDDGSLTPSGPPPAANTTGNAEIEGALTIGGGAALAQLLSAAATLDFPATAAHTSSDLTITVAGAAVGDVVALGIPHDSVSANSLFTAWVSAASQVTVRFNNYSGSNLDPPAGSFRVQVTKF
ncbi:MAG TPA: hypothetical protein VF131_08220 [Blastocatellia bacterium]|nr:hypothetical protein [Blastocatellia bacterium]